jgi:hypothetical protein
MPRERIPGIEEPLPKHETVVWTGAPDRATLARRTFRIRALGGYFGVLALLAFGLGLAESLGVAVGRATWILLSGSLVVGGAYAWAVGIARSTRYTVTNRRVVIQKGLALPAVLNIPFTQIEDAFVRRFSDETGDIALRLPEDLRIGVVFLWPHARPFRFTRPEPMLRGVENVERVGALLRDAIEVFRGSDNSEAPERHVMPRRPVYRLLDDDDIEILSNRPTVPEDAHVAASGA